MSKTFEDYKARKLNNLEAYSKEVFHCVSKVFSSLQKVALNIQTLGKKDPLFIEAQRKDTGLGVCRPRSQSGFEICPCLLTW